MDGCFYFAFQSDLRRAVRRHKPDNKRGRLSGNYINDIYNQHPLPVNVFIADTASGSEDESAETPANQLRSYR
jgi:hypothetical protein